MVFLSSPILLTKEKFLPAYLVKIKLKEHTERDRPQMQRNQINPYDRSPNKCCQILISELQGAANRNILNTIYELVHSTLSVLLIRFLIITIKCEWTPGRLEKSIQHEKNPKHGKSFQHLRRAQNTAGRRREREDEEKGGPWGERKTTSFSK